MNSSYVESSILLRVTRERISPMPAGPKIEKARTKDNTWKTCLTCRHCLKRPPKQQPSSKSLQPLLEIPSLSLHVTQGTPKNTYIERKEKGGKDQR